VLWPFLILYARVHHHIRYPPAAGRRLGVSWRTKLFEQFPVRRGSGLILYHIIVERYLCRVSLCAARGHANEIMVTRTWTTSLVILYLLPYGSGFSFACLATTTDYGKGLFFRPLQKKKKVVSFRSRPTGSKIAALTIRHGNDCVRRYDPPCRSCVRFSNKRIRNDVPKYVVERSY